MKNKIIIFDGICNLCTSLVLSIIKRDKDKVFLFVPMQSDSAKKLLEKYHITFENQETMVLIDGDTVFTKSKAAFFILRDIHTFWKLLYPFKILPIALQDCFYDLIAKSRYRLFGKKEKCMIPTDAIKSRFLD